MVDDVVLLGTWIGMVDVWKGSVGMIRGEDGISEWSADAIILRRTLRSRLPYNNLTNLSTTGTTG